MGRAAPFVDHYEILELQQGATSDEIRRSFRRLVLSSHPDKNPRRREWSENRTRELIAAYDVLRDERRRRLFDVEWLRRRRKQKGPVRPFFFERSDATACALRILYFLLHERPEEAARLLDEVEAYEGKGLLERELAREDYLDCLFLLAEHDLVEGRPEGALDRLREFFVRERRSVTPRHYLSTVIERLKLLYGRRVPDHWSRQEIEQRLREALELPLTPRERQAIERRFRSAAELRQSAAQA